mgnify:FL=1
MFNLFKKKKPWVRWYSVDAGVADLHPWFPARKLHRKWRTQALKDQGARNSEERKCPWLKASRMWNRLETEMKGEQKKIPQNYTHGVTCPAVTKVMDSGYILPLPADILIQTDGTGVNFQWMSQALFNYGQNYVKAHIPEQTTGMRETVDHTKPVLDWTIKLELPWRVQAHPDVVFMQIPIPYWEEDRFTVPTGIADPSYSYEINLQLFWHKVEAGEYLLEAGTPLAQWVPVHRDFLTMQGWDVRVETQNKWDKENNDIMEYRRRKNFLETDILKDRIESNTKILKLNKNIKRFN